MNSASSFYDSAYASDRYARCLTESDHYASEELKRFIENGDLRSRRCLEVGSGLGAFQDLVDDYTGTDLSETVAANYHKPFFSANAEKLHFDDHSFDAIWTITVLEHVLDPEKALHEIRRVLRPEGLLYLRPAWNCRPWICEGIPVRPCRDLNWRQRLVKLSLPARDSLIFRAAHTLPVRLCRSLLGLLVRRKTLVFKKLKADYSTIWMVDSDACSCIDPFDAIQWFHRHRDEVLSHPTWKSAFLSRSEPLIVRIKK